MFREKKKLSNNSLSLFLSNNKKEISLNQNLSKNNAGKRKNINLSLKEIKMIAQEKRKDMKNKFLLNNSKEYSNSPKKKSISLKKEGSQFIFDTEPTKRNGTGINSYFNHKKSLIQKEKNHRPLSLHEDNNKIESKYKKQLIEKNIIIAKLEKQIKDLKENKKNKNYQIEVSDNEYKPITKLNKERLNTLSSFKSITITHSLETDKPINNKNIKGNKKQKGYSQMNKELKKNLNSINSLTSSYEMSNRNKPKKYYSNRSNGYLNSKSKDQRRCFTSGKYCNTKENAEDKGFGYNKKYSIGNSSNSNINTNNNTGLNSDSTNQIIGKGKNDNGEINIILFNNSDTFNDLSNNFKKNNQEMIQSFNSLKNRANNLITNLLNIIDTLKSNIEENKTSNEKIEKETKINEEI